MTTVDAVNAARARFPNGIVQPEGFFRFSADALLLTAFATAKDARRMVDLGTGCGVVALGLALRFPQLYCVGIDREAALIDAARVNAGALGLEERVTFAYGDVAEAEPPIGLRGGNYDLVTANPPYRIAGSGRRSPSAARQRALEGPRDALADFARTAAFLLRHHGRFACVFLPARLGDLFAALRSVRLEPRRLCCVHPRADAQAALALVEARKNARADLVIETPLVPESIRSLRSPEKMMVHAYNFVTP